MDLFFLATGSDLSFVSEKQTEFRDLLEADLNLKLPASNGVFENPLPVEKICEIGGLTDDNETLTRRMLLLLEGEWVFNESAFYDVRNGLLKKYLHYRPEEDKICMFLLNDVIRYWRTICIDLEHKVYAHNKARDIRLIKLRFSRMLLYPRRRSWRACIHSWIGTQSIAFGPVSERRRNQRLISTLAFWRRWTLLQSATLLRSAGNPKTSGI